MIDGLALRPEIDRTRIVVAGQSFGVWTGARQKIPEAPRSVARIVRTIEETTLDGQRRIIRMELRVV